MLLLLLKKFTVFVAIASTVLIYFDNHQFPVKVYFISILVFFIMEIGLSAWIFYFFILKNQPGSNKIFIIGDNHVGNQLYRYFKKNSFLGLNPVGIISTNEKSNNPFVLGFLNDFPDLCKRNIFREVIVALPLSDESSIKNIIQISEKCGVKLHIVPNYFGIIDRSFKTETIGTIPLLHIRNIPLDNYPNRFWKRAFDIIFSVIIIIISAPFVIIISLLILIESGWPIFYCPIRVGVNGEKFRLYKFRSMTLASDISDELKSTVKNDTRITPIGKFLRRNNLDELPQFINVLKNEMSVVGPRPHRTHLNQTLQQKINNYMIRHLVKPGITGWAQVNGWRGPTEFKIQYMGRTLHDIWYIENWTFTLDFYILFLTVFGIKSRKNAF